MKFFYRFFGSDYHVSDQDQMAVCCPFPHTDPETGHSYFETHASAHIDVNDSLFHCKACGKGYSEASFLSAIEGISYGQAIQVIRDMEKAEDTDDWQVWEKKLKETPQWMQTVKDLGLSSVVDLLRLGYQGDGLAFPVFMFGELLATCTYQPNPAEGQKKTILSAGAKNLIFPFDLWRQNKENTLLCAGFKDAAIARVKGFNAITFTHGEQSFPKLFKGSFKGKHVYIAYDNDSAGKDGAKKAAMFIKEAGGFPHVLTGLYTVCASKGEDIHDFFMQYEKTSDDLKEIMKSTPIFTEEEFTAQRDVVYPLVKLQQATEGKYTRRRVSSRVATVATFEESMKIPAIVTFTKFREATSEKEYMQRGDELEWYLEEANLSDLLYLCEVKEEDMQKALRKLARVPPKEPSVHMKVLEEKTIWKAVVGDDIESEVIADMENDYKPAELLVYSVDNRVHAGQKYRIFYNAVPHPLDGQKVVAVTDQIESSDNSIDNFQVTPDVLESLKCFQGPVKEKMQEAAERVKGFAGVETLPQLAWAVDLFYHTPLQFKFGKRTERAYLEPMVVGESRTGKSQTAKNLLEMYELGIFTSLKTSTVAGLIGGSDRTNGGMKTRLGVIPRNHKSAVIMEEFSGGGKEIASKLTEIRSSNKVRITRVNGTTVADAMVRMLSISNQATSTNGQTIPLRQYPHGIKILLDLVGAAEDIGRYDFFMLIDKPNEYIDPTVEAEMEPYPKESYMNRVRWIWSRKPEQIIIEETTRHYIVDCAKRLNMSYDSHINFFGAEAWKKLTRLAVATAACVCSIDETGENLIVTQEHVKWARNFLVACYDNDLFKLREYVSGQRKYTDCPSSAVSVLQGIFNANRTLVSQMEMATELSQSQLRSVSGLDQNDFGKVINTLAECYMFHWNGEKIVPSERFRKAIAQIKQNTYMARVGSE